MNILNTRFTERALKLSVRSAIIACVTAAPFASMAAEPMSDDVRDLVIPKNTLDLGVLMLSDDSSKFGEYNSFNDAGGHPIVNFNIRGGDGYGMGDGTSRAYIDAANLGTDTPELSIGVADQGNWSLSLNYDEMRHYTTGGTYETPFEGAMGGNRFIMSPDFGVVNTTISRDGNRVLTSASQGARTLTSNQLSYLHNEDVYTERKNTGVKSDFQLDREWSINLEINQLKQSGAKLIGSGTDALDLTGTGGFNYGGERVAILMNPTQYETDFVKLGVNWVGDKGYASMAYNSSNFHDRYNGLSWSNVFVSGGTGDAPDPLTGASPAGAFPLNTMSTPPDNEAQQVSLTGGYRFSPDTKLVGGFSLGRNTQDQLYAGSYTNTADLNTVPGLPVDSLDGLVKTTHVDARLTHRLSDAWGLVASLRYNERDNQTDSYSYTFLDLGGDPLTVVNTPMSNRRTNLDIGGDYRINRDERLHLGVEYEAVKRWCNNDEANNAQGSNTAYYTTASCVQVPKNQENKLVVNYRKRLYDGVSLTAGYSYADRSADVNDSFYNPMQARTSGYENYGYLAYFDASRKQHQLKAGVNWQPADQTTVGINAKLQKDDYDSDLGVQKGDAQSVNVDVSHSISAESQVAVYLTLQQRSRDLLSANERNPLAAPGSLWSNTLDDKDSTLGLSAKQKDLMGSKLVFDEELTYSASTSSYSTSVDYTLTGASALGNISYGDLPDIKSNLTQLKLTGTYQLNKSSNLIMGYVYRKLESDDYYYNAYQYGYNATSALPTNQTDPSYTDHAILAVYNMSF